MALKQRVHEIMLIPSAPGDVAGRVFDVSIITLIALNTVAIIVESIPGATDGYAHLLNGFELFSVIVFAIEYALRIWSKTADPEYAHPIKGRLRWMVTPFAIIDLVAILPAILGVNVGFVRALRILRVLKLGRYAESVDVLGAVVRRSRTELATSAFLVSVTLLLASALMYYAERDVQPDAFPSIPHALWWGVVALTTTGYGDVVPITMWGRILGGFTAILGVATIALPVGILSSSFVTEIEERRRRKTAASVKPGAPKEHAANCPHCGHDLRAPPAKP